MRCFLGRLLMDSFVKTTACRCKVTYFNWITYKKRNFFLFSLLGWINVFYIEYGKNDRIIRNSLAG